MNPASPEPIRRMQQEPLPYGAETGIANTGAFIDERSEESGRPNAMKAASGKEVLRPSAGPSTGSGQAQHDGEFVLG